MNVASWLLWSFVATLALTSLLAGSQGAGVTRMNIPYLLGTLVTGDRDRAKTWGFGLHFLNGALFSLLYVAAFHAWGAAGWWRGAGVGLVHALVVLLAALPVMPSFHPRMASEQHGPEPPRLIEPPGFLGLHYGVRTPISVVVAHLVYGAILGGFYQLG